MKLHSVIISYQRRELTEKAIDSYLETVTLPHTLWVVDNGSPPDIQEWLRYQFQHGILDGVHIYEENQYPGRATNEVWDQAPDDATHLHRADNDFVFLPGWCEEVAERFADDGRLGQLGMRTDEEELNAMWNVGGNCVVRRDVFMSGVRYDETPWPEFPAGFTEDSFYSPAMIKAGWLWDRVHRPCIAPTSTESPEDPYYRQTWADRGIHGHKREEE